MAQGFLPRLGSSLIDAGYLIVPIAPGTKQPIEPAWTKIRADKRTLKAWLDPERLHPTSGRPTNYASGGIGLLTEKTPAVDIDVSDAEVADALESFVTSRLGLAPIRVGRAPKRLMLFRTDEPFPKVTSNAYVDGDDATQRVEILGAGQQFVAYAIHPDTGKPYEWLYGDGPTITPADELPPISQADAFAIRDEFHRLAEEAGWARKMGAGAMALSPARIDTSNPFADVKRVTEISEEDLERKLMKVPDPQDYTQWTNVGMALYHQYDGGDRGLELWSQWSEQAANFSEEALVAKWPSFDANGKGREPMTARLIIKLAGEEIEKERVETIEKLMGDLHAVITQNDFRTVVARFKHVQLDGFLAPQIEGLVQAKYKLVFGASLTIGKARSFIRYEEPLTNRETPIWLKPYVYDREREVFYNCESGLVSTATGLNAAHNRDMLSRLDKLEGRAIPELEAAAAALQLYEIPTVAGRRYNPQAGRFVNIDGVDYLNTYSNRGVPVMPDEYSGAERLAIKRVEAHFLHLFGDTPECREFRRMIAHVTRGGEKVSWAPILQGTEGDGKSFFYELLEAMLGKSNVDRPTAESLNEQYNGWAEGNQVVFFEEVKVAGHRYDVMNRMKPMITNSTVSIRRMRTDGYDIPNVTSYVFATNFKDALPLDANDTRYLVLLSRYQSKAALDAFNASDPGYYDRLFGSLLHAGALRKHFAELDIGQFNPRKRASDSEGRRQMVLLARDDAADALDDVLEAAAAADLTAELLDSTKLSDAMNGTGSLAPQGVRMNRFLSSAGFTPIGRHKVDPKSQNRARLWSKTPERFTDKNGYSIELIREYVAAWDDEKL